MPRRRRNGGRAKIQWTDRGKEEGRVKVEKASTRQLNTRHREQGRQDTSKVEVRVRPTMKANPGVEVKLPRPRRNAPLKAATKQWVAGMKPGMAYRLKCPMQFDQFESEGYPYQIAEAHLPRTCDEGYDERAETIASKGAMVIYLGPQRIDERAKDGKVTRETKHLFIIGAGRYVILDLNNLEPMK